MAQNKHKVFISYHHENDQVYKGMLLYLNDLHDVFIDASVDTGDIDGNLSDDAIREKIRDEYLRDSTVTVLLVGKETKRRKHIDWEIYSSMFNGTVNKQSGVLVINLPIAGDSNYQAAHGIAEKQAIYPETTAWTTISDRAEYERRFPYVPDRIIDNLLKDGAKVSVANWDTVTGDIDKLRFLIKATFDDRAQNDYDLNRRMRRSNS